VIHPDRAAEVSRGHSNLGVWDEGPNGPRKGLKGKGSKRRDS